MRVLNLVMIYFGTKKEHNPRNKKKHEESKGVELIVWNDWNKSF